jgi:hypothetical protein
MADMKTLMFGYKFACEIARCITHFCGEPPVLHPVFVPDSAAAIIPDTECPIYFDAPRIAYSDKDERTLKVFMHMKGV